MHGLPDEIGYALIVAQFIADHWPLIVLPVVFLIGWRLMGKRKA